MALDLLFTRTYLEVSNSLRLLLQGIAGSLAAFYCQISLQDFCARGNLFSSAVWLHVWSG